MEVRVEELERGDSGKWGTATSAIVTEEADEPLVAGWKCEYVRDFATVGWGEVGTGEEVETVRVFPVDLPDRDVALGEDEPDVVVEDVRAFDTCSVVDDEGGLSGRHGDEGSGLAPDGKGMGDGGRGTREIGVGDGEDAGLELVLLHVEDAHSC